MPYLNLICDQCQKRQKRWHNASKCGCGGRLIRDCDDADAVRLFLSGVSVIRTSNRLDMLVTEVEEAIRREMTRSGR